MIVRDGDQRRFERQLRRLLRVKARARRKAFGDFRSEREVDSSIVNPCTRSDETVTLHKRDEPFR